MQHLLSQPGRFGSRVAREDFVKDLLLEKGFYATGRRKYPNQGPCEWVCISS